MSEPNDTKRCPWCHGSGLNKAEYGPVPCSDCNGTGYYDGPDERESEEEIVDD